MEKVVQEQEVNVNKSSEIEQALSQAVVLINSNMICEAVEVLTGVLDVAMDKYGETALECAPLFFRYGQALLFQAQDLHKYSQDNEERRMSKDECSDEDEYSSDSSSDEDEQGVEECGDKLEKQNIVDASHCEEETQEIENEAKQDGCKDIQNIDEAKQDGCKDTENSDNTLAKDCNLAQQEICEENCEKEESCFEADLQPAWEYLETARHIYEQNSEQADMYQFELAEVLTCLGDVSSEREDFETALGDYRRALNLYRTLVERDDNIVVRMKRRRRIAETNFKLALAMQFTFRYTDADEQINSALETLKKLSVEVNELDSIDAQAKEKNLDDIQGSIDDLVAYQSELQKLSDIGGLARIKSAINAAQKVAAATAHQNDDDDEQQLSSPHNHKCNQQQISPTQEKENKGVSSEVSKGSQKVCEDQQVSRKRKLEEIWSPEGQLQPTNSK